jgi:hypothetical protein
MSSRSFPHFSIWPMKGQDPFQHQFQHAKWVCLNMGTPNSNALSLLFSYSIADLLVFRVGAPISDTHKNHIKLVLYIYIYTPWYFHYTAKTLLYPHDIWISIYPCYTPSVARQDIPIKYALLSGGFQCSGESYSEALQPYRKARMADVLHDLLWIGKKHWQL